MPEVRRFFRIEFINRIDEIIVFQPLTREELVRIAGLRFRDLAARLAERGIPAEITPAASRAIAELSYDPQYGARPINRFIQTRLENPLSRMLVGGQLKPGMRLAVDFRDGDFRFETSDAAGTTETPAASGAAAGGAAAAAADDVEDAAYTEI